MKGKDYSIIFKNVIWGFVGIAVIFLIYYMILFILDLPPILETWFQIPDIEIPDIIVPPWPDWPQWPDWPALPGW